MSYASTDLMNAANQLAMAATCLEQRASQLATRSSAVNGTFDRLTPAWSGPDPDTVQLGAATYLGRLPDQRRRLGSGAVLLRTWASEASGIAVELLAAERRAAMEGPLVAFAADRQSRAAEHQIAELSRRWDALQRTRSYELGEVTAQLRAFAREEVRFDVARAIVATFGSAAAAGFFASGDEDGETYTVYDLIEMLQFFAVADPDYAGPLSIAAGPDLSTDEAAAFWEWFREQKRDHEYGDGSYYSMNGFTATYPNGPAGTTLDLSLESDIEFDDVPDDHPVFEQDGVVITVIGIAADPDLDFDDGQPSTARIVGAQAGGLLACSLASSVGGGLACGAVTNLVSGIITQSGDAQATIPCVVVATPIDEDGTVVGQPVLTTADIGVTLSPQEQLEQMDGALEEIAEGDAEVVVVDGEQVLVTPLDAASAQVLPAYGNTFVVMDDVENSSPT